MTTETDPQIAVVTGASSGVDRAVARAFGAKGHRVALRTLQNGPRCRHPLLDDGRSEGPRALVREAEAKERWSCGALTMGIRQLWPLQKGVFQEMFIP